MNPTRKPAVAGTFYPADPGVLRRDLETYLKVEVAPPFRPPLAKGGISESTKLPSLACLVPHAGYVYSGHVAGAVYSRVELPRRLILMGPNHGGRGQPLAIMSSGTWLTPLGEAQIDEALAREFSARFPLLQEDSEAHRKEHSLEVQIPFLQTLHSGFSFLPIVIATARLDVLIALGEALADLLKAEQDRVLLVISSDMNHYEPDGITRQKDARAIEKILELDAAGLHDVVRRENITMCGFAPTVVMIAAARKLEAEKAELVKYATSADVSGDRDYCVGYAGIVVTRQ